VLDHVALGNLELCVLGAQVACDLARVAELAVGALAEATEKVFTFALWRVINATIVEESRPPERNAPKGTSLTICMRTDSSRC
jgi:hypothetical protein